MFFIDWPRVVLRAVLADHPGLVELGPSEAFEDLGRLHDEARRYGLTIVMTASRVFAVHPSRFDRAK
jgi:hypothetical protein